MVFNSFAFLIFFPIFLLLYRILPLKVRWIMMLILSLVFYMSWQADLLYLILFTTLVSYVCARKIEKHSGKRGVQKAYMMIAVIASLFVLFFFIYFNFVSKIYPIQSTSLNFQSHFFILSHHSVSPGIMPYSYN